MIKSVVDLKRFAALESDFEIKSHAMKENTLSRGKPDKENSLIRDEKFCYVLVYKKTPFLFCLSLVLRKGDA